MASNFPATPAETIITNEATTLFNVNMMNVTKLTDSNFLMWSIQIQALLDGYELGGYLDGSINIPSATHIVNGTSIPNPAYNHWKRQDRLLFSSLLGAISTPIQPLLSTAKTSQQIWETLYTTYANPSRERSNGNSNRGFLSVNMEASLTARAIEKIMNGEVTSEREMRPVLQVTELKLLKAQQDPTKERFRMLLSDGTHLHQGMLGIELNNLVKSGTLQSGSIVRLTHFVSNVMSYRRIVIVMQLDVIKASSDIIGHPVPGGKPNDKRGADSGIELNTTGSEEHGRSEPSGAYQVNNAETGRSTAAISPQVGQRQGFTTGSSVPASTVPTRAYNNQSAGHGVLRQHQMEASLTAGAIEKIMNGEVTSEREMTPVLQVTELKLIKALQDPTKERFRMLLSDGTHLHQGMLGTEQNNLVKSGTLQSGSIVRLTHFVGSVIHGRSIVVVVQLEVIKACSGITGHPVPAKPIEKRLADLALS